MPDPVIVTTVEERAGYWYVTADNDPTHIVGKCGLRRGVELPHVLCVPGEKGIARYVRGASYGRWEVTPIFTTPKE